MSDDLLPIALRTVGIGAVAALAQLAPAVALGRALAHREFRGKALVQALLVLPMFLPPVAVGLLLLLTMGGTSTVLFHWPGAVVAASVVAFPLLLRHSHEAFAAVPVRLSQVSWSLGVGRWETFWRVELPLARRGIAVGLVLAFARGVSEYGATAVVAGVIPGRTETLSTGLMRRLNTGDDAGALALAGISVVIGLAAVLVSEHLTARGRP